MIHHLLLLLRLLLPLQLSIQLYYCYYYYLSTDTPPVDDDNESQERKRAYQKLYGADATAVCPRYLGGGGGEEDGGGGGGGGGGAAAAESPRTRVLFPSTLALAAVGLDWQAVSTPTVKIEESKSIH